jgi:hypothetical protein
MKNIITSIIILASAITAQAQAYLFEVNTGNYTPIDTGITIWGGVNNVPITSENIKFKIPFYFGEKKDSLNNVLVSTSILDLSDESGNGLGLYGVSFYDGLYKVDEVPFVSEAIYQLEGEIGSRIAKFEFKDIIVDSFPTEFYNYQVWVYESNQAIEYRYGANNLSTNHPFNTGDLFTYAGMFHENDSINWIAFIGENSANPSVRYVADENNLIYLNEMPVEGTIYRFYRNTSSVNTLDFDKTFSLQQNGSSILVTSKEAKVLTYDVMAMNGQVVLTEKPDSKSIDIDVAGLSTGVYILQLNTNKGSYVKKLMF